MRTCNPAQHGGALHKPPRFHCMFDFELPSGCVRCQIFLNLGIHYEMEARLRSASEARLQFTHLPFLPVPSIASALVTLPVPLSLLSKTPSGYSASLAEVHLLFTGSRGLWQPGTVACRGLWLATAAFVPAFNLLHTLMPTMYQIPTHFRAIAHAVFSAWEAFLSHFFIPFWYLVLKPGPLHARDVFHL